MTANSGLVVYVGLPKRETRSVLLYGAEVRADPLGQEVYHKRLVQEQRRGTVRVVFGYRIVSEPTGVIIARMVPVFLSSYAT